MCACRRSRAVERRLSRQPALEEPLRGLLVPAQAVTHDRLLVPLGEGHQRVTGFEIVKLGLGVDRPRLHAIFRGEDVELLANELLLGGAEVVGEGAADGAADL
jgi:hypothetical protein